MQISRVLYMDHIDRDKCVGCKDCCGRSYRPAYRLCPGCAECFAYSSEGSVCLWLIP